MCWMKCDLNDFWFFFRTCHLNLLSDIVSLTERGKTNVLTIIKILSHLHDIYYKDRQILSEWHPCNTQFTVCAVQTNVIKHLMCMNFSAEMCLCLCLAQATLVAQWTRPAACWEAHRGTSVDAKAPPTTQGSSTLPSEWLTFSSTLTRWKPPRATALNRNMRWDGPITLLSYTLNNVRQHGQLLLFHSDKITWTPSKY